MSERLEEAKNVIDKYIKLINDRFGISPEEVYEIYWLIQQAEMVEGTKYLYEKLNEEHDEIISKLADIRKLFDESDKKAEGHDIETEMVASPYAVALYTENKMKRLIEHVKELQDSNNNMVTIAENRLKQIRDLRNCYEQTLEVVAEELKYAKITSNPVSKEEYIKNSIRFIEEALEESK